MSKLIVTPRHFDKRQSNRLSRHIGPDLGLLPNSSKPFDDSIYDSNQIHSNRSKDNPTQRA